MLQGSPKQLSLMNVDRDEPEDAVLSHNTDSPGIDDNVDATGECTERLFLNAEPVFTIEMETAASPKLLEEDSQVILPFLGLVHQSVLRWHVPRQNCQRRTPTLLGSTSPRLSKQLNLKNINRVALEDALLSHNTEKLGHLN